MWWLSQPLFLTKNKAQTLWNVVCGLDEMVEEEVVVVISICNTSLRDYCD